MSLEIIKKQIDIFLSDEAPAVMAIKGEWGVGKTYTWNKYLLEAQNENRVSLPKYSYVSAFGAKSLDSFKYSIFENVVDKKLIGSEASIQTFKKNSVDLLASLGKKSIKLVKGSSLLKDFTPAIESLSFLSLEKTLICIDDLERTGDDLSVKDILGLISTLKEQRNCKVIILLNDKEDGLEDYTKYREKVVDTELKFAPTAIECASIAFDKNDYEFITLKELTQKLGIRNIRILKKAERLVELSKPLMSQYEQETKYQIIHSLALFTWCHYCLGHDPEIPTLDYIINKNIHLLDFSDDKYLSNSDEETSEKEKKWNSMLLSYGYQLTSDIDLVLAESVRTGYFIEESFKREADKLNKEIIDSKSEGSFHDTWKFYHGSFDNNKTEVVNALYESFKKNVKNISLTNLNGTVILFKDLGEKDKASELIDIYIEKRKSEKGLFNLKENNIFGDVRDPEIVNKFDGIYKTLVTTESAEQVLERISEKDGWNPRDEVALSNTSPDEFYRIFKDIKGKKIPLYVKACLQFGNFSNPTEQQKTIADNATTALKTIASESDINKRRVKSFGIYT